MDQAASAEEPAEPRQPPEQGAPEQSDDGTPRPLGVGIRPTAHSGVDTALRRLADTGHLAVPGHLEVYEDVHRGLRDTLTALDQHDSGS